jgi:hypothetical protein
MRGSRKESKGDKGTDAEARLAALERQQLNLMQQLERQQRAQQQVERRVEQQAAQTAAADAATAASPRPTAARHAAVHRSSSKSLAPTTDDTSFHVDDLHFFEFELNKKPPAFLVGCLAWFVVVLYTPASAKWLLGLGLILVFTMCSSYYTWYKKQKRRLAEDDRAAGQHGGKGEGDSMASGRVPLLGRQQSSRRDMFPSRASNPTDKDSDFTYSNCWDELFSIENEDDMTAPGYTFWLILGPVLLAMIWGGAEYVLWTTPGGDDIVNGSTEFPCVDDDPGYRLPCFLNHCTQSPLWIWFGTGILVALTAGWERSLETTAHIQAKARVLDSMTKVMPGGALTQEQRDEGVGANSVCLKGVPAECDDDAISSALAGFGTVVSVSHHEGRDFAFAFAVFDSDAGKNAAVAAGSASVGGADATITATCFICSGKGIGPQCTKDECAQPKPDTKWLADKLAEIWDVHFVREGHRLQKADDFSDGTCCKDCPLWKCSGRTPGSAYGWKCRGKGHHEYPCFPAKPPALMPDGQDTAAAPGLTEKYAPVCALLCGCACALLCRGNRTKRDDGSTATTPAAEQSCFGQHGDHGSKRDSMVQDLNKWSSIGFMAKVVLALSLGGIYLLDPRFRDVLFPGSETANEHPTAHPWAVWAVFVAAVAHTAISLVFATLVLDNLVLLFSENYMIMKDLGDAAQLNGDGGIYNDGEVEQLKRVTQQLKLWWWLRNFAMNTKCTLNFKLGTSGFVTILSGTLVLTVCIVALALKAESGDLAKPAILATIFPAIYCMAAAWKCLTLEVKSRRQAQLHAVDLERRVLNLSISMRGEDVDGAGAGEATDGFSGADPVSPRHGGAPRIHMPDGTGQSVYWTDSPKRRHLEDLHETVRHMTQLIKHERPRQIGGLYLTDNLLAGASIHSLLPPCALVFADRPPCPPSGYFAQACKAT